MTLTLAQRILAATTFVVLAFCAVFAYSYASDQSQKSGLDARLATIQTTVDKINAASEAPNADDPLLHTPAFPRDPPDLALASAVLSSAAGSGVSTGPIQTTSGGSEKIGSTTYRTTTLNLTISGTLPQILNFFDRMEQTGIRSLVFDNIRFEAGNGQWIVQMQILAYAQPE